MFHIILSLALQVLIAPAMASDMALEYDVRIGNFSTQTVMAWEVRPKNVLGWQYLRLRLAPGEQVQVMLKFGDEATGSGSVSQVFAGLSGKTIGKMSILHHRTFSYPAFIVEELYVRAVGDISLGLGGGQSILVSIGRTGQQVLCSRSIRESSLWFFFL